MLKVSRQEDISYNLTKDEAVTFLEKVLGISDPVGFVNKDKVGFLEEMMRKTKLNIPFTNITYFKEGKVRNPSLEEIKQANFAKEGGNCFAINTFTNAVLQCLGFDMYIIGGSVHRWDAPLYNSHAALIAKDLTIPGSLHLVDVGSQYFLPLISLDFDRISQVYHIESSQYRFFQVSPGVVQLTRRRKTQQLGQWNGLIYVESGDSWEVLITFRTTTPRKLAECHYQNDVMAENPRLVSEAISDFLLVSYPNDIFVSIFGNYCRTITETGHTELTEMKSPAQVVDTILKYFPQYSGNHLERMADFFKKRKSSDTSIEP